MTTRRLSTFALVSTFFALAAACSAPADSLMGEGDEPETADLSPEEEPLSPPEAETAGDLQSIVAPSATVSSGVPIVNSCTPLTDTSNTGLTIDQDVLFATIDGQPLRMDIARPADGKPHPLVLAIHGGGWSSRDKSEMANTIRELAHAGYTAATLNYRLFRTSCPSDGGACNIKCSTGPDCHQNPFPSQLADVRCGLRWLRQAGPARRYGVSTALRSAALGTSAGAHLAAMLGASTENAAFDGPTSGAGACPVPAGDDHVDAVVAYYPPSDLAALPATGNIARGLPAFLGIKSFTNPSAADQAKLLNASPIGWVDRWDPPTLLVHGVADTTVPVAQSRAYQAKLRNAGVRSALVETTLAHGFGVFSSTSALRQASCTTARFLSDELNPQ